MWYIDTADWTAMVKLMKQRILIKYLQRLGFIPVMGDPFSWNDAMYDILIFIIDHTVAGILIINTHILVSNDTGGVQRSQCDGYQRYFFITVFLQDILYSLQQPRMEAQLFLHDLKQSCLQHELKAFSVDIFQDKLFITKRICPHLFMIVSEN